MAFASAFPHLQERAFGIDRMETYRGFAEEVRRSKRELLRFLIDARDAGKRIAGYGAPAKASTLLNYCGARTDFIDYTVDRNVHKQGLYLSGTRDEYYPPARVADYGERLRLRAREVEVRSYDAGHEIVPAMRNDVRAWLIKHSSQILSS